MGMTGQTLYSTMQDINTSERELVVAITKDPSVVSFCLDLFPYSTT